MKSLESLKSFALSKMEIGSLLGGASGNCQTGGGVDTHSGGGGATVTVKYSNDMMEPTGVITKQNGDNPEYERLPCCD